MGFRTVVITNHCKCSYKNDYMLIQNEELKMVHLSEIDTVIFESVSISISGVLLAELTKRKVCIIFCDERHLPYAQQISLSSNYMSSARLMAQIEWDKQAKDRVWSHIIERKIENQALLLKQLNYENESKQLYGYISEIEIGDLTNREGTAAKVYFNALFGKGFCRKTDDSEVNACLDYGYSVLLAMTAREIVKNGYNISLGIHHIGVFNPYNLACDVMEPFRPVIDKIVLENFYGVFDSSIKMKLWNIANLEIRLEKNKVFLPNAINLFFRNICSCIENGEQKLLGFSF